ncbi:MAG: beta-ketoacyl-ACP synthase II [Gammaproteobacteria bacterium]|nr:beta-ketoacyl-ACP synthase II [Gammaproteobacteria bacterium]
MAKRRVVVTGMGMITPLGLTVKETWEGITAGKSGIRLIKHFDASESPVKFCGNVENFDATQFMNPKDVRRLDTFIHYGVAAAKQAIEDSHLDFDTEDLDRIGIAIGSGIGGLPIIERNCQILEDSGPRKISPFFIPGTIINMVAGYVSIMYGLKGPNIAIVTACTTGTHNIGHAARMITYGDADVMVTGGTEMATSLLSISGFASSRALSTRNDDPERASRPWDKDRDGFVLGEGAGVLILEEYEHAKKRGATIYAELIGFGMSADAYHMTAPEEDGKGFVSSMINTLHDAKIAPEQVDYINAHGTSTPVGDVIEALAIKKAFGAHAYNLGVSSTKSMTGHLLGAAGAVEAIISILAMRDQVAPPTINLDNPDEGCDLNFIPKTAQEMKINIVLSNSFGFGGTNGSLLFKRVE